MDNPYGVPREASWEEDFVTHAVESARAAGLHVEVYPEADYEHGGITYTAVTIPEAVHQRLLDEVNAELATPQPITHNQPLRIQVPFDQLPTEVLARMPTYRSGYATARSALNASMRAFDVFEKRRKMQAPPSDKPIFDRLLLSVLS